MFMKIRLLLLSVFLLPAVLMSAQKIIGIVLDEKSQPVEYASVVLLNSIDSTMLQFTHSNRSGAFEFEIEKIPPSLIQISYLGYETYWQTLEASDQELRLDSVELKIASHQLQEIEIKDYISPMSFGKDTIQYNAAAFKVKPGDVAEDLLRKLPGIEVERDGSVKALGEKVENVLVDGKEFFGKDTKIATKNLDADAIDKVQVFDRKSERSQFTGIDDGQRERSINLKLKDDKKVGYFGTTEAGAGSSERFKGRANLNRFTPNLRTSFIGMANNINEQNFSINDYIDFMGGIGSFMSGGGSGSVTIDLDQNAGIPIGLDNNEGIQKSFAGGLNLNRDFSKNTSLEASVFGNSFENTLNRNSIRENLISGSSFRDESRSNQISGNHSGSYSMLLKTQWDSTQRISFRSSGAFGRNNLNSVGSNQVFDQAIRLLNDNIDTMDVDARMYRFTGDLLWQKKFGLTGRNLSLNGVLTTGINRSETDLSSGYRIYSAGGQNNMLLQLQEGQDDGLYYKTEASYTEPIAKRQYLEFKTSLANQNNKTSTDYFDIIGETPIQNIKLSTLYQRDYAQKNIGIQYSVNSEKFNLILASRYKYSTLLGEINEDPNKINNSFYAILPSAFFNYRFGISENLNFNYFSELNEPSLRQLQPVVNNSNPLAIYQGNPGLRPEQNHQTYLSYMKYDAFHFTMLYASLRLNYTQDKIAESLVIDSALVQSFTPVNTKSESTVSGRVEYDTPIRPLKVKVRAIIRCNYNNAYAVINSESFPTSRFGYGYTFSVENRNKEIVEALIGFRANRSDSKFSQDKSLNQYYREATLFLELGLNFGSWVQFKTNLDYQSLRNSFSATEYRIPLWTAGVTAFLTKDRKLRASLNCFDILNKNRAVRNFTQVNYSDLTQSNVLRRYLMLSFAYNLRGFREQRGMTIDIKGAD